MLAVIQRVPAATEGEGGFWATAYPILPHPGELVMGLLAFAVVYWVYKTKVVPALEEVYRKRHDAIEGGMARAERAEAEAKAAKEELESQLAAARQDAARMREDARAEASTIAADIRQKAADDAARMQEANQRQLEAERNQAMVSLRRDVGGLATTLAGRIVGQSLDDRGTQSGVIDRFLAELEEKERAGAGATAVGSSATTGDYRDESALARFTKQDEGR